MATKIKDSATAEKAALNLNKGLEVQAPTEPNAPKEKSETTRMFPDFITDDGMILNRPVKSFDRQEVSLPATETVVAAPQTQTPQTQAPTVPSYITEKDLAGKMAKIKVDGVEQDVSASELFKLTQLERHSNAQLMKVAQERAQMERERQEMLARPTEPVKPTKQEPPVKKSAEVEALEARLAQMEQSMIQERALLMPQIQEAGIKRVEKMVKEKVGTEDFREYFDKIRTSALEEVAKPEVAANPQARAYFDSDAYYFQKYQEMKLRDLTSKAPSPAIPVNPTVPVLQTQQGAPVLVNNSGQPVSIPSFESSSGVPSTPSEQGNWQSTYNTLVQRFKANPSDENAKAMISWKFRQE